MMKAHLYNELFKKGSSWAQVTTCYNMLQPNSSTARLSTFLSTKFHLYWTWPPWTVSSGRGWSSKDGGEISRNPTIWGFTEVQLLKMSFRCHRNLAFEAFGQVRLTVVFFDPIFGWKNYHKILEIPDSYHHLSGWTPPKPTWQLQPSGHWVGTGCWASIALVAPLHDTSKLAQPWRSQVKLTVAKLTAR